ncbi:unnamed protein product [Leuciscus chuanchicus]
MVSRSCVPPRRESSGDSCQEGPSVPSRGLNISPPPRTVEPVGLASEGAQLIESGLSTEVVETILQSRAPSTRKLYALKWRVFTSWCSDHRLDPVNCPIGTVLEFLQDRFTAGLTPSTLKVYVAAIGAYHIPLGGMSVGKDPLVSRFLRGTWRLRPAVRSRVPPWDLSIALQGLSLAPFEPIEEVPEKFLTLKALFLFAISSLKRIGDLQALSVAPSCLEFAPGMVKAFLHPRPGYIPKVPTNVARPIVLQAFCPPPFQNADQEANNLLCPVRALDAYVHRAALWRKSDQLFVCFGSPNKGGPVSKKRMSKWVVEAISLAYEAAGQPSPLAVWSHSTRSMAASKALKSGVSLQDVCDAAGWSSPHTFVRFYSLDLDSTPGSQVSNAGQPLQTFGSASLNIMWPYELVNRKWLLYPRSLQVDGHPHTLCEPQSALDPLRLGRHQSPQAENLKSSRKARSHLETEADVAPKNPVGKITPAVSASERRKSLTLDCLLGSARCLLFRCPLDTFSDSIHIRIRANLWNSTFMEEFSSVSAVELLVRANITIKSDIRHLVLKDAATQVSVMIYPEHGLADQHSIPWWIILIAVLAGVIVLALLVCVLWKCGFFHRVRYEDQVPQYQAVKILRQETPFLDKTFILHKKQWATHWSDGTI